MANEEQQIHDFVKELEQKFNDDKERAVQSLTEEQSNFFSYFRYMNGYSDKESALMEDLKSGLLSGKYKKPSEFFTKKCKWLFKGVILPRNREMFLYAVDNVNRNQYSNSYWRRSFRSRGYGPYFYKILGILHDFYYYMRMDADYCDILALHVSEQEYAYISEHQRDCMVSWAVAYVLDQEPEKAEEIIIGILNAESEIVISNDLLYGICMSKNAAMHEYLGKLLVAARLQEGLRQSICEVADEGTIEAFQVILRVIEENNLIRFSAVKRAVGTWTGLIAMESDDLDRISAKTLKLIRTCMDDKNARDQYLYSEDSMEIYLALWAYGCYELKDAMEKFSELVDHGSHHQILTAGYFAANLDNWEYGHQVAKKVIQKHQELDILAVFFPYFMSGWNNHYEKDTGRLILKKDFFENKAEAEQFYVRLWEIYNSIPKKSVSFSPCIFPWYSAELEKADVIKDLCLIACILEDNDKIDKCCVLLKNCGEYVRRSLAEILFYDPQTDIQRAALTDMLSDRAEYVRDTVFELIKKVELKEENYIQMESMLRYKSANIRANLISLLYKQEDDALLHTIQRLLADKKEEKRTAGLDLAISLLKDETKKDLFGTCRALVKEMQNPSTKEKILIDSILGGVKKKERAELFGKEDRYNPELPEGTLVEKSVEVFMRYFPQSSLGNGLCPKKFKKSKEGTVKDALQDVNSLLELVKEHKTEEFHYYGETKTMDCEPWEFWETLPNGGERQIPFRSLWHTWCQDVLQSSPERIMRACVVMAAYEHIDSFAKIAMKYADSLYGKDYSKFVPVEYRGIILRILSELRDEFMPDQDQSMLSAAAEFWFMETVPDKDVMMKLSKQQWYGEYAHLIGGRQMELVFSGSYRRKSEYAAELFALDYLVEDRCINDKRYKAPSYNRILDDNRGIRNLSNGFSVLGRSEYIYMAYRNFMPERTLYSCIFNGNTTNFLDMLSNAVTINREKNVAVTRGSRSWESYYKLSRVSDLLGKIFDRDQELSAQITEEDAKLLAFADRIYEAVIGKILPVELARGDTPTEYSYMIRGINRIYGLENYIAILSALGKDTLERSRWTSTKTKKGSLSHLLSVCIPNPDDDAKKLKKAVKATDITEKRMIEAALYSPEWLDITQDYLGWKGFTPACYYFMAHMNEAFDDRRKAMIAKYTPLPEEELMAGAFDLEWFKSAYKMLGETRFNMIYDAAKYISDGAKHSRARKYADAALGKMDPKETAETIFDKRNKDLLMAYSLIPLGGEEDLCERYLNLTKFLKQSKQFGSQRIASEKKAVDIAMQNLATCAGYADVTRLTLRMETKLIDDSRELFEDKKIDDIVVRLSVSDAGKPEIICIKGEKKLKSVPAKIKKNEYILRLSETKKKLTEQYRRTKQMFEQAMEDSVEFLVSEILALYENPVALPIIKNLVFLKGKKPGFIEGNNLIDYAGKKTKLKDDNKVTVAHPYALYIDGHWADYQRNLFERKIVQPFKQVFRELYIKTEEEVKMDHSLRYAGNQIQPAKTVACLKSRRWVADVEDGLQKVYYKDNIVARIYAMADWFSPADIEAPTLEWVEFSDRKTGKLVMIDKIPDIIFSEVMRDVDLAVSVAHAGGVDPETSHSTMEMRAALLEFTLPLFKLDNIEIKGNHAHIHGNLADYTLHLGSGVVHKQGGAMINILPVHSQHRGKLFLPFADDDPKTAEILSKAILLAEDEKIKDPMILGEIKGI